MTEETQVETPIEDAPVLPDEQAADSSPAEEVVEKTPDDVGEQPRDEDGKFLSAKAQKRIDELTWRVNERDREIALLRAQSESRKPQEPPKVEEPIEAPNPEDFYGDSEKYRKAFESYTMAVARAEVRKEIEADRQRAEAQKRIDTFQERVSKSPAAVRVLNDHYSPISPAMGDVIRDSESSAELLEWIGENRDQAAKIARLPAHLAAKELGKVESFIEARKAQKPRPVITKAPPPPPQIDANDASVKVSTTDPESDKLSVDEWVRLERKRMERKAKRNV